MRKKSTENTIIAEINDIWERSRFMFVAIIEKIKIATEMAIPVGMENFLIFLMNWFLMRVVFFSNAKITPGNPMQTKLSNDISIGMNGY